MPVRPRRHRARRNLPRELQCSACGDRRYVATKDCARIRNRVAVMERILGDAPGRSILGPIIVDVAREPQGVENRGRLDRDRARPAFKGLSPAGCPFPACVAPARAAAR
jgi:hypothetical protein